MRYELLRRAGYCLAGVLLLVTHAARAQDAQITVFSIAEDNPPPGLADSGFGAAVAVSGQTILIGVPFDTGSRARRPRWRPTGASDRRFRPATDGSQ